MCCSRCRSSTRTCEAATTTTEVEPAPTTVRLRAAFGRARRTTRPTTTPHENTEVLTQPTKEKLHSLHLGAFAKACEEQQKHPDVQTRSFDARLGLLVDAEWLARENARVTRNLREAKLRISQAVGALERPGGVGAGLDSDRRAHGLVQLRPVGSRVRRARVGRHPGAYRAGVSGPQTPPRARAPFPGPHRSLTDCMTLSLNSSRTLMRFECFTPLRVSA